MKCSFGKILVVFLVCSIIISTLTFTISAAGPVAKPEKITMMTSTVISEGQGLKQLAAEFKKFTGIELEIIRPDHNKYSEVMEAKFASGDVPDVMDIGGSEYAKYGAKGDLYDVTKLIENSEVLGKLDSKIIDSIKIGGKAYAVPHSAGSGVLTYVREDWLNKLSLKAPTTYDEYIEVLKAFRDNDPDGNGVKDTIPFTAVLSAGGSVQLMYLRDFFWDASPDFTLVDGKYVDGFSQDNFKAALKRIAKAYDEKLIDNDLFTNKTSSCRTKFYNSKAAVFPYWNNYWVSRLEDNTRLASDPKASVLPIPAIKESVNYNRAPGLTAISSKAKNPEGIFKHLFEFINDGGKGQTLFSYGVEGVHWKKGADGKAEMLPMLNNKKKLIDKVWVSGDFTVLPFNNGPLVPTDPRIVKTKEVFNKKYQQLSVFPLSETYAKNISAIESLRLEIAKKAISGEVTVDAAIEEYKAGAAKLEVAKIINEFNTNK